MKVTIKDIARETGLSTATISKYLNKKPISEENRALIQETIERLHYRPNRTAQILRAKRTHTIGIMLSDFGSYFWAEMINTITNYFIQHHYAVITSSYSFTPGKETMVVQDLISQHPDGVIVLPQNKNNEFYKLFLEEGIPVVVLDNLPVSMDKYPVDCVTSDHYKGGKLLAEYLLANGHKSVSIFDRCESSYTITERIRGFLDVYHKNGIDTSGFFNQLPEFSYDTTPVDTALADRHFQEILKHPVPPTAIFFTNYDMALGVLQAAASKPHHIIEELSLVCFDDDPLFKVMAPPITSVAQDLKQISITAAELLRKRIHKDYSDFPAVKIIDVEFRERKSVKKI